MIRLTVLLLTMLWLQLIAGCTVDSVRHGIYEGIRARNDLQRSPSERMGKQEEPNFSEYERLRTQYKQ
jgi:hypothetical protein